ncbi:MAG: DUF4331 domain-containing protein [Planctomycetota bacterium]|nr:MAG: DUF4331 domain-containing protein [Planctomycetota bacterium]
MSLFPLLLALPALVSSHREAPQITELPKVDATDFYMFRAYEPGRGDSVVLVANYVPLQAPYGGPNYFTLDPNALYEIKVDNNGDAIQDLTFQFRFANANKDIALEIGPPGNKKTVSVPLINVGSITAGDTSALNVTESYTVKLVQGAGAGATSSSVTKVGSGATTFEKPVDNIGEKSIADYEAYANAHIHDIALPGGFTGRMFVGQRKDPFVVNLGEVFDLVNLNPLGPVNGESDLLADANVTSIVLELPIDFLVAGDPVIGGWTTASLRQARVLNPQPVPGTSAVHGGAYTQVSRLSAPLVNEVVIGLKDKDRFNASEPKDDAQFADYVTHPTLPALLEALFGVTAPTAFPRADLVQAFLTGVPGLNVNGSTAEMLRLNTDIAPAARGAQNNLGVIGGDLAGFPNGRRPGDDVVDIELRVAMGVLLPIGDAPSGQLAYTDGAYVDDSFFSAAFPYLLTPLAGASSN